MFRPIPLVVFLTASLTYPAMCETGVAFVHGSGNYSDALDDYWDHGIVDIVRTGLSDPDLCLVTNCNFDQFPWTEAAVGSLAEQLVAFITEHDITDLVIITHSGGGNVMRWMLSNPTWDPRYAIILPVIRDVNALAPSSLGTPLANAAVDGSEFEESLSWLLNYERDMVRFQQTHWIAHYNAHWLYGTSGRPALPKPFWAIVGTDVESSSFDPDSYCGGYSQNLGLEITQEWLDSCSDGFLDCTSQAGAGEVWFYDTEFTEGGEPLSHNQSRKDCFGLSELLRADVTSPSKPLFWQPEITFFGPFPPTPGKEGAFRDSRALFDQSMPIAVSWTLDPNQQIPHDPPPYESISRGYCLEINAQEAVDGWTLPVTASHALVHIHVIAPPGANRSPQFGPPSLTLTDASGNAFSLAPTNKSGPWVTGPYVFRLPPESAVGPLSLHAQPQTPNPDLRIHVTVLEQASPVALHLQARRSTVYLGERILADAHAKSLNEPWNVQHLTGHLVSPSGRHFPLTAHALDDQTFQIEGPIPAEDTACGLWEIRVTAMGEYNGMQLRRDVRTACAIARRTARLSRIHRMRIVPAFPTASAIETEFGMRVARSGRYQIRAVLSGTAGGEPHAIAVSHSAAWLPSGDTSLNLLFDRDCIRASGLEPPFQIQSIHLMDQTTMHLVDEHPDVLVHPELLE